MFHKNEKMKKEEHMGYQKKKKETRIHNSGKMKGLPRMPMKGVPRMTTVHQP